MARPVAAVDSIVPELVMTIPVDAVFDVTAGFAFTDSEPPVLTVSVSAPVSVFCAVSAGPAFT
jgi:hypothetical protein